MAQRASWGWKAQRCHCSPGCLPPSPGATVLLGLALQPLHSDDSHAHGYLFRGDLSDEAERAETGVFLWKLLPQSWVLHSPNLALPLWHLDMRSKQEKEEAWYTSLTIYFTTDYCVSVRLLSPMIERT